MLRRAVLSLFLLCLHLFSVAYAQEPASVRPHTMLIPLYSYPNWWDEDAYTWRTVIDLKRKHRYSEIIAIINPNNGDFNSSNSDFERGIEDLRSVGIRLVGYVYTSYGDRNATDIKENIDAWSQFYKPLGIEGIFFDETSTDTDKLSYYLDLTDYSKSKEFSITILNPGITTDQSYIDANITDIIITYENAYADLQNTPPSSYNTPSEKTRLAILIHQIEAGDIDSIHTFAAEKRFEYFYYTDDGEDGNPWDTISSTTDRELQLIDPVPYMISVHSLLF